METKHANYIQLSAAFGGILGFFAPFWWSLWLPLLLWLAGPKSEFNDWHGREAVRWQLVTTAYMLLAVVLAFVFLVGGMVIAGSGNAPEFGTLFGGGGFIGGLFLAVPVFVVQTVMPFVASSHARKGEWYVYPFVFSPRRRQNRAPIAA